MSAATTGAPAAATYPHDLLWDALREVEDPELGISIVDMGLVVAIRLEDGAASVQITYTAMGCPATGMIEEDARERLLRLDGVDEVAIEVVWDPVWTAARLTSEARDALLLLGVSV
jgi:metal-sulfur cluster biosynthetic enzyme